MCRGQGSIFGVFPQEPSTLVFVCLFYYPPPFPCPRLILSRGLLAWNAASVSFLGILTSPPSTRTYTAVQISTPPRMSPRLTGTFRLWNRTCFLSWHSESCSFSSLDWTLVSLNCGITGKSHQAHFSLYLTGKSHLQRHMHIPWHSSGSWSHSHGSL